MLGFPAFALSLGAATARADAPGGVTVYVFAGARGGPLAGARVAVEGGPAGATNADGVVRLSVPAGAHAVTVEPGRPGMATARIDPVAVAPGEITEVIVALGPDGPARVAVEAPSAPAASPPPVAEVSGEAAEAPPVTLAGVVTAETTGRPVAGARIFVRGRPETARTDAAGRFRLVLPAGRHGLSVIHPDFSTGSVEVEAGEGVAEVRVALAPAAVQLEDFRVTAPYIEGGVAGLTAERRETTQVVDVLGSEEMSRAGDGSAAGALKRVTGLTVVDGRFIYVRGMGERYSSTLLNGITIPSPEPERRVVPLDLFSTGILGSVLIQKTTSADMPGDFGGGVVRLRTRGVPEEPFLKVSLSTGYRADTTFRDGLRYRGGDLDWLGIDDGTRALPAPVRRASEREILLERSRISPHGFTAEQLERFGEMMPNIWETRAESTSPPVGVSVAGGHRLELGGVRLGGLASLHYDQDWRRRRLERAYYIVGRGGELELQHRYDFDALERTVELGGIVELNAEIGRSHRLAATTLLLRMTDDEARVFQGPNRDVGTDIRVTRLRWIERMLLSQQLRGEHAFGALGARWHYAFSRATRDEPDRRTYRYDREPTRPDTWLLSDRPEGNQRLYNELVDDLHDGQIALRLSLADPPAGDVDAEAPAWIEAGGQAVHRARGVDTRRFKFQTRGPRAGDPAVISRPPEEVFVPDLIGNDAFQFQETTRQTDNYTADQRLFAGWIAATYPVVPRLVLTAGLRVEHSAQTVETFELFNPDQEPVVARLEHTDPLPSAGLTWKLDDGMQVRAAFGQSVSRPDFRELSPATFNDVTGGRQIFGNPDLDRAVIRHYDLRWEWYPDARSSVSVAGFFKQFDRPIETIVIPSAQFSVTYENAVAATNLGAEIDGRTTLGFVSPALRDAYVAGNVAWIRSRVELDEAGVQTSRERALEGQSPYVINAQIGYDDPESGARLALLYNVAGRRIVEVGASGAPDVYEEPFHQLDAVAGLRLGAGFSVELKASNLLNPKARRTQGGHVTEAERKGRFFGVGLSWEG